MRRWWLDSSEGLAAARNVSAAVSSLFSAGGVIAIFGDRGVLAGALIGIGLLAGVVTVLLALAEARAKRRIAQEGLDGGVAPGSPRDGRSRIGRLVGGAVIVAIIVGTLVAVVLSGGGDEPSKGAGKIVRVFNVPAAEDLAVAGGLVWLVDANAQTAIRISEVDGEEETIFVDQPPSISEPLPGTRTGVRVGGYRVAARGERAWIVTNGGMVFSVGPDRRAKLLNPDIKVLAGQPALYRGALWIGGFGEDLYRLRAASGAVQRQYALRGHPFSIEELAAGVGSIWAYAEGSDPDGSRIYKLTPVAGQAGVEEHTMPLDHPIFDLAAGVGGVWTVDPGGTVTWHDPATGGSARPIQVPGGARRIALGREAVWVTTGDSSVVRIDPTTLDLVGEPTLLPGNASAISADENAWVIVGQKLVEIES